MFSARPLIGTLLFLLLVSVSAQAESGFGNLLGKSGGDQQDEFLEPDQAFQVTGEVSDNDQILLHWEIADGYYLYRDRFQVTPTNKNVKIRTELPPGEEKTDPEFGQVTVFHHAVTATIDVISKPQPQSIELEAVYQGCKENEICYPPIRKTMQFSLPTISGGTKPVTTASSGKNVGMAGPQSLSQTDSISYGLMQRGFLASIVIFFGFGLLLAFTPCIFPMIPILSGIIVGQGEKISPRQGFLLSSVYVVSMSVMYAILGIIAAALHFNIQAAAQNPWVIATFSLVFVVLAMAMFEVYELQLPSKWQTRLSEISNRQRRGNLVGAAIMGILSAIIVGPCVAPPLAGALIYISQSGDLLLGGSALFAMGLGMGVPLLIIGTSAGHLLPRAGRWMKSVKHIFGWIMLGVAIWFLDRIVPPAVTLLLSGGLLVFAGVFAGAMKKPEHGSATQKVIKSLGIIALVYGITLVVGAAGGGTDILRPLNFTASDNDKTSHLSFVRVKTVSDLEQYVAQADFDGKIVMLDFYADWCITCKEMERYTFSESGVHKALENFVLLQANVTDNDEADQALMKKFNIIGPPAILFFVRGQEQRKLRLVGFVNAQDFIKHLYSVSRS